MPPLFSRPSKKIRLGYLDLNEGTALMAPFVNMGSARFNMGGGGSVKEAPKYSQAEMKLFDEIANKIRGSLDSGATPYTGKRFADQPQEFYDAIDAFKAFNQSTRGGMMSAIDQIMSGQPSFTYDPTTTADYWQKAYATPALQVWENDIRPTIEEGYAGNMFNTRARNAVAREKDVFYGSAILPQLYQAQMAERQAGIQSGENAVNRMMQMAGMLPSLGQAMFTGDMTISESLRSLEQQRLDAAFNEFLRLAPENDPWIQTAIKYRTGAQPTMDYFVQEKISPFEMALGGLSAMGGLKSGIGELGSLIGGIGGLFGGGAAAGSGLSTGLTAAMTALMM